MNQTYTTTTNYYTLLNIYFQADVNSMIKLCTECHNGKKLNRTCHNGKKLNTASKQVEAKRGFSVDATIQL